MKVVTLDERKFAEACRDLAERSYLWKPDCLLGIRTGGYVVAKQMQPHYTHGAIPVFAVTKQRSSTKTKQNRTLVPSLLKILPYGLTDSLRVLEHKMLTRKVAAPATPPTWKPDPSEWLQLTNDLAALNPARILVVDDAVDTGVTLCAVENAIKALAPKAQVRTAVIVQSTPDPLVHPDDVLFSQQLCRFPWSHDFKQAASSSV